VFRLFALCVPLSLNKYAGVSAGTKHLPDTRVLVAHKKATKSNINYWNPEKPHQRSMSFSFLKKFSFQ